MSSLITDQHAMDPEVLVSLWSTRRPWNLGLLLWSGLAKSWTLGVCVVVGLAVSQWGASISLLAVGIAPVIVYMKDHFVNCPKTGGGAWMNVLHNAASISATASSLSSTLDYIANGKGRHWLDEHIGNIAPDMLALATLFGVTFLFVLGLERSTLLRAILIFSVSSLVIFFSVTGFSLIDYTLLKQLEQMPNNLPQVLHCAAFFACAYAGVTPRRTSVAKQSSFAALSLSSISYAIVILLLALIVEQQVTNPAVYLVKVFEIRDLWWAREAMSVLVILSLSLSLPELFSSGQSSVDAVAGHIVASAVSKENLTTGTQIYVITLIGFVCCLLVVICPLRNLLCLSSAAYLLTQVADILSAVHRQYQPSFLSHKLNSGYIGSSSTYMLLAHNPVADQTALLDSSEDEHPALSDDSGHSSDTDIDAIVAEYKERIKVVTTLTEPLTLEPTLSSSRRVSSALLGILLLATSTGVTLLYSYYWTAVFSLIVQLFLIMVIISQPRVKDPSSNVTSSSWVPTMILVVNIVLVCHLVAEIAVILLLWSLLGIGLWCHTKRLHFCNFKGKMKRRKERIKLRMPPSHRTVTSYLPNYRKMTHVDTVFIMR